MANKRPKKAAKLSAVELELQAAQKGQLASEPSDGHSEAVAEHLKSRESGPVIAPAVSATAQALRKAEKVQAASATSPKAFDFTGELAARLHRADDAVGDATEAVETAKSFQARAQAVLDHANDVLDAYEAVEYKPAPLGPSASPPKVKAARTAAASAWASVAYAEKRLAEAQGWEAEATTLRDAAIGDADEQHHQDCRIAAAQEGQKLWEGNLLRAQQAAGDADQMLREARAAKKERRDAPVHEAVLREDLGLEAKPKAKKAKKAKKVKGPSKGERAAQEAADLATKVAESMGLTPEAVAMAAAEAARVALATFEAGKKAKKAAKKHAKKVGKKLAKKEAKAVKRAKAKEREAEDEGGGGMWDSVKDWVTGAWSVITRFAGTGWAALLRARLEVAQTLCIAFQQAKQSIMQKRHALAIVGAALGLAYVAIAAELPLLPVITAVAVAALAEAQKHADEVLLNARIDLALATGQGLPGVA